MSRDKRIDAYIAKAQPFAQPILVHLRDLVHRVLPEVEEAIKWGMPHFTFMGKNVSGMAAFKAHCAFMIHGAGRQGAKEGGGMGHFGRITALSDLPSDKELEAKLLAARDRVVETGWAKRPSAPRRPKGSITVPQDLAAALKANEAAQAVFEDFPPSSQREYVEWITEAKQEATRERRLNQAIEWIAEGKRRNWKYEKR